MTPSLKFNVYLFSMFFCSIAMAQTSQTKVLQLSAHIDNEKFFSYQVTKFGFDESKIIVNYNRSTESFYSESTDLVLETDIPVGFSAGFELIAKDLSSVCINAAGDKVEKNFASYWVDGEVLSPDVPVQFESFNNANKLYLNDKRDFTVNFDALPSFDPNKAYCSGAATLIVSLDF